ncbi:MAG: RidA family protein [Sphingomonas sp.]|nr:RidA family protein [Sphingomonas sp.]
MSRIAFFATAALICSSSVAAAPQYYPAPPRQGAPAPFSTAVQVGDVLYMSGQIGVGPDGKLPETFDGQAKQVMENVGGVLKTHGLGWGNVFKCTVMIADMKNWPAFNAVYVPYFPAGKLPARSAFGANGLALGAQLELECLAYAGKK